MAGLVLSKAELLILIWIALALLSLHYIRYLPLRSSAFDLLPLNDPLVKRYRSVEETLTPGDFVALLLKLRDPPPSRKEREDILLHAAEAIRKRVISHPEIKRASYRVGEGVKVPEELLLIYKLKPKDVERLRGIAAEIGELSASLPLPRGGASVEEVLQKLRDISPEGADPVEILSLLRKSRRGLEATEALLLKIDALERLEALLGEAADIISRILERPLPEAQPLFSPDKNYLLIQVWPRRPSYVGVTYCHKVAEAVSQALREADLEKLGVEVGVTGTYIAISESDRLIQGDLSFTTLVSSIGVLVILLFTLRSLLSLLATLIPLLISAVLTMAWAKLSVGGFNLITVFLPALVLGLGVDYSLHLVLRISEELRKGADFTGAIPVAFGEKGPASMGAALTSAMAFASLILAKSLGLKEMGIIMSLGIFLSLGASVLVTPALLSLAHRFRRGHRARVLDGTRPRLARFYESLLRRRRFVVVALLLLMGAAVHQAVRVGFVFMPQDIAPVTEAQRVAREAMRAFRGEVAFRNDFLVFVEGPGELEEAVRELSGNGLVSSVSSLRDLLPSELLGKEASFEDVPLEDLKALLTFLKGELARWEEERKEALDAAGLLVEAELAAAALGAGAIAEEISRSVDLLLSIHGLMGSHDPAELGKTLKSLEDHYAVIERFMEGIRALPPEGELLLRVLAVLPEDLKAYYSTVDGRFVIHVEVKGEALADERLLGKFISWLKARGYDYFGFPEVRLRLKDYMRRDFVLSTSLAAGLILSTLFLYFLNLRMGIIAGVPLIMGYLFMLAGMRLLGIDFNFVNISISPLLIGLGVDAGIHMAHRLRASPRDIRSVAEEAAAAAVPVLGSSLTTMVVFGTLLFANTPGLKVLGICALLGLGFSMIGSLLFVPASMAPVERDRWGS